jgi:peptidoglycan/xylan/chitin deacetylase (PgdA/CDA1 family)
MANGKFIISLDFELMWGIRDQKNALAYRDNILGERKVIPRLLETFRKYEVKSTFSTVGMLFFENKQEMLRNIPEVRPDYEDKNLSPYNGYLEKIGDNSGKDLYHFGADLIKLIQRYPEHEIGTHTFSHYYCLEKGQGVDAFREDIKRGIAIAQKYIINISSLVFPRNQFNEGYLQVCSELGIICYRGNEESWLYSAKSGREESLLRRSFRLLDSYVNLSGHHCYSDQYLTRTYPVNIPASRFLRPFSKKTKIFDWFKLQRIRSAMTYAAKNNLSYHLWWHPHNFGVNMDENFAFLEKILSHYQKLHKKYNFQSVTMTELARNVINGK